MSPGTIHVESPADRVARLVIDNPPANAIGRAMRDKLLASLAQVEADESFRAVILTGRGKVFCGGDDLREESGHENRAENFRNFGQLLDTIERFRVPVIAAINGWCVGGGFELALCCDIRIASTEAEFVCAGVNVGLTASGYRLPRLIGVGPAKQMLLTGLETDADTAYRFGLVTAVHKPNDLPDAALALATRIASRAPLSVEATKRLASQALDQTPTEGMSAMASELAQLVRSADHTEAVSAFLEKRPPNFKRA